MKKVRKEEENDNRRRAKDRRMEKKVLRGEAGNRGMKEGWERRWREEGSRKEYGW